MRLICPNCGAQYDVPTNVIPDAGRDVQCSSCGHTWFQRHPDADPDLAEELDQPLPDPEWTPEPEPAPEPDPAPPGPPAGHAAPPKREIDPEMAELFREERELAERQRGAEALETQPDLGLAAPEEDERARRSRQARQRMANLRGEDIAPQPDPDRPAIPQETAQTSIPADAAAAAAAAAGSRRDLLPDVEEINQTLRASSEPRVVDSARDEADSLIADQRQSGGGFGKGFLLVVALVAVALAVYAYAPRIAEMAPQLTPTLEAYVTAVNGARDWLDAQFTTLLQTLDGMSSEAQDPDAAPDEAPEAAPDAVETDS